MTGRLRLTSRPLLPTALAAVCATAIGAAAFAGCDGLPGARGDSRGPITVMTWAPEGTRATNMAGMPAMATAFARWVNAGGGIHGRELKVLTCNERNDTVTAADCAQRAVREGAVAVVGSYSQHGRSMLSPLEASGTPFIGGYGITNEEFSSPLSYPVNGGQATLLAGNGRQLAGVCKRVALVRPDTIAGDQLPALLDAGLAAGGRPSAADVRAPEDATDYTRHGTAALESAGKDDGACVTAALGERTSTFFDSFRRLRGDGAGTRVRIAAVLGSVQQSLVDRTGGAGSPLEGAYATGWYPAADDARWEPMRKVIAQHAFGDNRVDPADPGVQTTWLAYTVLRSVLLSLDADDITPASVRQALDGGHRVDTGGLTPPLRWQHQDLLAVRNYPRVVNANVTYQVVRDGRLVAAKGGFINVARTLEEQSKG
ncbi:ABC transporter substrate-binding protein [Streptomyces sp. NPDC021096]|uniref:ABC transporter substrate-binding protein n=1 Tax=Streptomyces sp. NPDC021096 TaxID=3154792 RepID=UPI0033D9A6D6